MNMTCGSLESKGELCLPLGQMMGTSMPFIVAVVVVTAVLLGVALCNATKYVTYILIVE